MDEGGKKGEGCLRVASYNIHQGEGGDGRRDLGRIAAVIERLAADVVALQEVHVRFGGGEESRQLDYLAAATGMTAVSGATLLRPDGHYGNGALVRTEIVRQHLHDLSFPAREPRGVVDLVLATALGRLRLLATHLGLRPAERRYQVRRLLALIEASEEPVILAGDFNEWFPWGRPARWLARGFTAGSALRTFPARYPIFPLDRIFVGPGLRIRRLEAVCAAPARIASDHLPLLAQIARTNAP